MCLNELSALLPGSLKIICIFIGGALFQATLSDLYHLTTIEEYLVYHC